MKKASGGWGVVAVAERGAGGGVGKGAVGGRDGGGGRRRGAVVSARRAPVSASVVPRVVEVEVVTLVRTSARDETGRVPRALDPLHGH